MKRKGNQGWRCALGTPAVGMLVFWASLPATFAENDAAGAAVRETGTRGHARAEPAVGSDVTGYEPGAAPSGRGVVCEFEDQAHCQLNTGEYIFLSDRFQGTRRADDFRPQDSPIRSICFSFGYLTDGGDECTDGPPSDDFHIRFYEDAFGFPETELPDSPGPVVIDGKEPIPGTRTWQFHATVGGAGGVEVTPGECYWLEITGMGDDDCATLWTHSVDGNNYGLRDDNMSYGSEDIRGDDMVFCLDTGIVAATIPGTNGGCGNLPGACCTWDRTCEEMDFQACSDIGGFGFPYATCPADPGDLCPFPENDLCDTDGNGTPDGAAPVCEGDPEHPERGEWRYWSGDPGDQLGQCDDWPGSAGYGQVCNPQTDDCREPSSAVCMPHLGGAYECWFDGDNRLALTDGPVGGGACGAENAFQADVWHKITAPCYGSAVVTMCDGEWEYDGMLSVYGDDTLDLECPGPGDNNEDLLECNDDYCRGSGTVEGVHWDAVQGAVYLLRQGGWSANGLPLDATQGRAQFHIGFFCNHVHPQPPGLPPDLEHRAPKHRYLSIDVTTNSPATVAWRVELVEYKRCEGDLEEACAVNSDCTTQLGVYYGPCVNTHPAVGSSWWVQEPQEYVDGCRKRCYTHDGAFCDADTDCLPPDTGSCIQRCGATDQFSRLEPTTASAPYFSDWTDPRFPLTTLHIGDCEVVPVATYEIRACALATGAVCGLVPLVIGTVRQSRLGKTQANFGDIVAAPAVAGDPYGPPDGWTTVSDMQALNWSLRFWRGTDPLQLHVTWADLDGSGAGNAPEYVLQIGDMQLFKQAFQMNTTWRAANSDNHNPNNCPP